MLRGPSGQLPPLGNTPRVAVTSSRPSAAVPSYSMARRYRRDMRRRTAPFNLRLLVWRGQERRGIDSRLFFPCSFGVKPRLLFFQRMVRGPRKALWCALLCVAAMLGHGDGIAASSPAGVGETRRVSSATNREDSIWLNVVGLVSTNILLFIFCTGTSVSPSHPPLLCCCSQGDELWRPASKTTGFVSRSLVSSHPPCRHPAVVELKFAFLPP